MLFPKSLLQSLLALYGLAPKSHSTRRRPAPVLIGNPTARWR
jgi:hypothetical protein